jgi:cell surface protein SprA
LSLDPRKFQFARGLGMLLLTCLVNVSLYAQQRDSTRTDTVRTHTINPYRPSYRERDRYGDPFSNYTTQSPLYLKDPKSINLGLQLDSGMNYTLQEKMGNVNVRPMTTMTFDELSQQQNRLMLKDYWQGKSKALDGESAVSSRNLIPKIYVSPVLDRIFGGSYVELIPKGFVTLDFGAQFQKIENPAIPIRQQRNGGFEFDQQINLNVTGKVGEKLAVTTNFDNNNSFDFQNNFKVEYTGFKEDILKKLEIGNVSLPLNNSLITGAQNLFGVKSQMQFGKLFVTSIATTQRGKQSSIVIQGSTNGAAQGRPFEIVGSSYDDNRHFFLSHFFRDNFEKWLSTLPQITSGVNITRVDVYVLNRTVDTQTNLNVLGLMDMGETNEIYRKDLLTQSAFDKAPAANGNNDLFTKYLTASFDRTANNISGQLDGFGFTSGTDYELVTSARKLAATEFTFHKELGYITLQRKLQNDEVLAVAFEYSYNGKTYKVGELNGDYANVTENQAIFLKLLRPRKINIKDPTGKIYPTWNLMMKNIYNLNVSGLTKDGFQLRVIYRDDKTGIDNPQLQEGDYARTKQLIEVFGLDRLNPYNDPQPDGNFDYVERATVIPETGLIIFPYLQPFNTALRNLFNDKQSNPAQASYLINKYVYDTLYHTTKAEAELVNTKNKFYIVGSFKAGSGKDIIIQGFNISPGSVKVYAGGTPLREGTDYTVDYTFGKVTILNEGILSSGKDINITYEQQDPFAFQTRSLLGSRFDYKLNDDINIGSTVLYYNERPLITRNAVGSEPARNLQYGIDLNMKKNSRFLTKMVDALPFLQTKEVSTINLNAEFAQLLPGTSNKINGEGTSFIDDFENSATPYSLITPANWKMAAVPTNDPKFDLAVGAQNDLRAGYKRAKLAWYQIDNIFYRQGSQFQPKNIKADNHYQRAVLPTEIFPQFTPYVGNFYEPIFDLAYYPGERGQYNFNPDLNPDGTLKNPAGNWAGITSAVKTEVDFDKANIEYIEFWMMDPFMTNANSQILDGKFNSYNTTGGKMVFHVGSVSEDVMRDGKHAFENGLPKDGNLADATKDEWGYVTNQQYLNNAFDNTDTSRPNQDVGLDGVSSSNELSAFKENFLDKVTNASAKSAIIADPAADDFQYFLGSQFDDHDAQTVERYKNYNGMENNSPVLTGSDPFARSGTNIPDNEDLNADNTLSDLEEYYSYTIDLKPGQLDVGKKFIVDKITPDDHKDVTWYLFRIPIRQFDEKVGDINDFKSIKYIRTYLTGFQDPVVIRLAKFRAIGNKWRRYTGNLEESKFGEQLEPNLDNFTVSTVNVEENSKGNLLKPSYIPPLKRDRDVTSTVNRLLNEQSVQLCATGLQDGDARAIYKNVTMDFFNYGRLKMFLSAHTPDGKDLGNTGLTAFIRLGTDFDQNYYEIEIPLAITKSEADANNYTEEIVWPEANEIDLDLYDLYALKVRRDRESYSLDQPYPVQGAPIYSGKHKISVLGRPDMSQVRTMMIGVRNPKSTDGKPVNICIWADELRLTDFDRTAGWAANAVLSAKLADLGTVTGSIKHIGFGYGGVQSKISERARGETNTFDVSANIAVDKLLPKALGLKIPMFASYENSTIDPKYDPANPDVRIQGTLNSFDTDQERTDYLKMIQDRTTRRSLNFTNVRKVKTDPKAVSHIYDVENFAFTYAYSESNQTNFNLEENTKRNYKGAAAWQYAPKFKGFEPFKNSKVFSSPFLQLIKDFNFNPLPSNISVRGELDRSFSKLVYRNSVKDQASAIPNYSKYFVFNRYYNVRWSLTKALTIDYASTVNAIIDEPDGDINTKEKIDSVKANLKRFGRTKNFTQNITANYTLPLDKFPLTNWLGADYRYNVGYSWKAGPLEKTDSLKLGNIIQNTQDQALNGKIDFLKLYNKIGFLKAANTPKKKLSPLEKAKQRPSPADTVKKPPELSALKSLARLIMSLRSITGTYTLTQGTILPGFTPDPYLFGMDKTWSAPGWGFVLGSQDPSIRFKARDNGWMSTSDKLTTPFTQSQTKDISMRASVEPTNDLKIQLDLKKTTSTTYQEIFRIDSTHSFFESLSPTRSGSYKISILTINTAFKNNSSTNSSVFQKFTDYINTVGDRFASVTGQGYEKKSQDVLIPAFIAAYTGKSPETVSLSPFPNIPVPNWRVDYNGLSKLDIFKDIFQSVTLSHAYSSSYQVTNYTNSLDTMYQKNVGINVPVEKYNNGYYAQTNTDQQIVPIYVISQVMISEQFAPLIGINFRTKKKLTVRVDYKTKRDLSLNISNAQITEVNGKDWALELGYTKNNLRLPFRDQGRVITLKNDVTFRVNLAVSNNRTIQRKIDEDNVVTNGNINIQIRPNIQYVVNQKLNIQFYMDRNVNEPLVTNSYRRATTKVGTKIVFNLSQ